MTNNKFDDVLLNEFINNFYGYGNYKGEFWFIGKEEAIRKAKNDGVKFNDIKNRIEIWEKMGKKELEDVCKYSERRGITDRFEGKIKLSKTWCGLMKIILKPIGAKYNIDDIKKYQKDEWGRRESNNCLIELMPLPKKSTKDWFYNKYSDITYLRDKKVYWDEISPQRIEHIKKRLNQHNPKVVVFYSTQKKYVNCWERIIDRTFNEAIKINGKKVRFTKNKKTLFVITTHPVAHGISDNYLIKLRDEIRKRL